MKKYPKTMYLEEGTSDEGYSEFLEDFDDGTVIGIYKLVSVGRVKRDARVEPLAKKK